MDYLTWETLPVHILANIFSKLSYHDRFIGSLVCKSWSDCFNDSQLWKHFKFKLDKTKDPEGLQLKCIDKYAEGLRTVDIAVHQMQRESRERSVYILNKFQELKTWKLVSFTFGFSNNNPPCFNGRPILNALKDCLDLGEDKYTLYPLQRIDLSNFDIPLDDKILDILSNCHKSLKICRIQNSCLVDNTTPEGLLNLLKNCTQIEELWTFYHCTTDDVLECLGGEGRAELRVLSLKCNRSDKYLPRVSTSAWQTLTSKMENLQVYMEFDSAIPLDITNKILCHGIPVTVMNLSIYCWAHEQLHIIAQEYNKTLTTLHIHNSIDRRDNANAELIPALMQVVKLCTKLTELHCYCVLPASVIDNIKRTRELKKFTLY